MWTVRASDCQIIQSSKQYIHYSHTNDSSKIELVRFVVLSNVYRKPKVRWKNQKKKNSKINTQTHTHTNWHHFLFLNLKAKKNNNIQMTARARHLKTTNEIVAHAAVIVERTVSSLYPCTISIYHWKYYSICTKEFTRTSTHLSVWIHLYIWLLKRSGIIIYTNFSYEH